MLIVVPDNHQSLSYVFTETVNETGFGGGGSTFATPMFWYVFATGLAMAQYTITGYDASAHMAEETHQASRMAAVGHGTVAVVVSVIVGFILLVAVTFAIPDTAGAIENFGIIIPWIWSESMSQNWSEALLFIVRRGAVLLPHRLDHLRVADAVRVLARPGGSGPSRSGARSPATASRTSR